MSKASSNALHVRYFAWVREKVGRSEESCNVPSTVTTVEDLIYWLRAQGPEYEAAFAKPDIIRTAVDQKHVKKDASLRDANEVAFFPPVTGG